MLIKLSSVSENMGQCSGVVCPTCNKDVNFNLMSIALKYIHIYYLENKIPKGAG
jgi:hypothetical protein